MDDTFKFNVVETLLDLYCLYRAEWVCMTDADKMPKPNWHMPTPFNFMTVGDHIDGKYCVAVYAGKYATKFLTFDVDEGGKEVVRRVVDTLVDIGIPRELIYISFSGKKGYHVDIFFKDFVYNEIAEKLYWTVIERGGFNYRKVEYRPTHGQAIKLPLGVHQTTKRRCWFVDQDTLEPIEDFGYIFHIERIPQDKINDIVLNLVNEHMRVIYNEIYEYRKKERDQHKVEGNYDSLVVTEPGTRHNLQTKVAARARMDGCEYDEIVERQMEWYRNQDRSLINSSESEVLAEAEALAKWAVMNVEVKQHVVKLPDVTQAVTMTKDIIPYLLHAPSKSFRMVLFLLCVYCWKYGEVKISYETIAAQTRLSVQRVFDAVKWLTENRFITKENTNYKYDKIVTLRSANIYRFPGKKMRCPNRRDLLAEEVTLKNWITPENIYGEYIGVLARMCRLDYLAKYLTKPELAECKKYMEDAQHEKDAVTGEVGDSAGSDGEAE